MKFSIASPLLLILSALPTSVVSQTYNPDSYEPIACTPPITFRSAAESSFDGKWSYETQIGVSGGGWNKVHAELTSRSLEDGETFKIKGNKLQVGVGLCIETCDLESAYGIRWKHNCVGYYGDNSNKIYAANENNEEYFITSASNPRSSLQGFTYDKANNCITHIGSHDESCAPLPAHFKDQKVRAIGQVWNSAKADIV